MVFVDEMNELPASLMLQPFIPYTDNLSICLDIRRNAEASNILVDCHCDDSFDSSDNPLNLKLRLSLAQFYSSHLLMPVTKESKFQQV